MDDDNDDFTSFISAANRLSHRIAVDRTCFYEDQSTDVAFNRLCDALQRPSVTLVTRPAIAETIDTDDMMVTKEFIEVKGKEVILHIRKAHACFAGTLREICTGTSQCQRY
mmetsp:Transcript_34355/g.106207  ORF Transcript_34355/g.106207 Transcript_34355/m.106207 type:complete len:111 (-) Transcript_34355:233-565(-)